MLSLQEISDRLEIQDVMVAYCYAVDTRNWDALDEVFTADAVIDYSEMVGVKGTLAEIKAALPTERRLAASVSAIWAMLRKLGLRHKRTR